MVRLFKNNTRIKFIYKKINLDDSIGDIKKKIFVYLSNIKNEILYYLKIKNYG